MDKIIVSQQNIRLGGSFAPEHPGKGFVHHFSQAIGIQFVNKEFGAGGRFERFISGRVVGMTVSVSGFKISIQPIFFLNKAVFIKFTLQNLHTVYIYQIN